MRLLLSTLLICLPLIAVAGPDDDRKEIQEMRQDVLTKLYKEKPATKSEIEKSKGYAVFSSLGINLFVVSTARGAGVLHDKRSKKDIYMNMFSAGGGIGLGVKDFSAVFVFSSDKARIEGYDVNFFVGQFSCHICGHLIRCSFGHAINRVSNEFLSRPKRDIDN